MGRSTSFDLQSAMESLKSVNPELAAPECDDSVSDESVLNDDRKTCGRLDIIFEKKGRAGKQATIVAGFCGNDEELQSVASELKRRLGAGGSARGGEILIQGDRRKDVLKLLTEMGYKARVI